MAKDQSHDQVRRIWRLGGDWTVELEKPARPSSGSTLEAMPRVVDFVLRRREVLTGFKKENDR